MAHGITETDTIFSVGERAWHKLGTVVQEAPSIKEALKLSGLDWNVRLRTLYFKGNNTTNTLPNKKVVVKTSDNTPLGIVGNNYSVLQNNEAFEVFEPLVESGLVKLETAGSLYGGSKVFILAKISSDDMEVTPGDAIEKYILLSNSHDGSMAARIGFTPIRVVCDNTLSLAHTCNASKLIKIYHTGNIKENIMAVRETLDVVNRTFETSLEAYKELAKKQINQADLQKYVRHVFSTKSVEKIITDYEALEEEKSRKRLIGQIEEIFEKDPQHNAWGMYNAVNGYFNHTFSKNPESNYNAMWYGSNARKDKKALKLALAL